MIYFNFKKFLSKIIAYIVNNYLYKIFSKTLSFFNDFNQ